MLPAFIIIGAMKSGTSSLYRYLATHPDTVPSSIKETDFFRTHEDFSKGLEWYESLFDSPGRYAFEASPNYTKRHRFPGVPERIRSVVPAAKLIYVVRDPIGRVVSHYIHNRANGRESQSFSQAIQNPNSVYVETSRYFFQLQAYLDHYPDEQIYLVQLEQLSRDPVTVLNDICGFLGIPAACDASVLAKRFHKSESKKHPSWLEQKLVGVTSNPHLKSGIRTLTRPLRKPIDKPILSDSDQEMLHAVMSDDAKKLREYSGCSFPGWSV